MITAPQPETTRQYDVFTREWRTVTVPVTPAETLIHTVTGIPAHYGADLRADCPRCVPVTRTAGRRHGAPVNRDGLSDGSPLPDYMCDTAYAEIGPLADERTWVKPDTMKPHRPAVVMPAKDMGEITDTSRRR